MADEDYGSILDEEEVTVEVRRPVGGIVSVRFNGEEMRELRSEVNLDGGKVSSFIKRAVWALITQRRAEREAALPSIAGNGPIVEAGQVVAGSAPASGSGDGLPVRMSMTADDTDAAGGGGS